MTHIKLADCIVHWSNNVKNNIILNGLFAVVINATDHAKLERELRLLTQSRPGANFSYLQQSCHVLTASDNEHHLSLQFQFLSNFQNLRDICSEVFMISLSTLFCKIWSIFRCAFGNAECLRTPTSTVAMSWTFRQQRFTYNYLSSSASTS